MMGCDICKKPGYTEPLNKDLMKVPGVEDICNDCKKVANNLINKYRRMAFVRASKKLRAMKMSYDSKDQGVG